MKESASAALLVVKCLRPPRRKRWAWTSMARPRAQASRSSSTASGVPFYRREKLPAGVGLPLPASTQGEIVAETAELLTPAFEELLRQAAQGEVLPNDDTQMRVLRLARPPSDPRPGVFTGGIVCTRQGQPIALYFTGRRQAGENRADLLRRRGADLRPPIQMRDALSRHPPQLSAGAEVLPAHCPAHGRGPFVDILPNFPGECRYVLEQLGRVYGYDADARQRPWSAAERLHFHQQHSAPVREELHGWLEAQPAQKRTEPNSNLGQAITY